jgi:hypothetical protein
MGNFAFESRNQNIFTISPPAAYLCQNRFRILGIDGGNAEALGHSNIKTTQIYVKG